MSKQATISFGKIPTLYTTVWTSDYFKNTLKWRDRSMEGVMQRFVSLNQKNLAYLGITAALDNIDGRLSVRLTTSKFVGAVPLKSPMNGKLAGDLTVVGRFGENSEELLSLLKDTIDIEYSDEYTLVQESQMTPPVFTECCKYIDLYLEASKYRWHKFNNVVKVQHQPSSSTMWAEYAQRTAKEPLSFSTYRNKVNILSVDHREWRQLSYIIKLAIEELESVNVPIRTRSAYSERITRLKRVLQTQIVEVTDTITERMTDPLIIKKLKRTAIIILNNKTNERLAWRLDYAKFFEQYVQYLFNDIVKKKGMKQYNNPHYGVSVSNRPLWGLSYIEPDLILQKEEEQYVVDAKYKSHVYNWNDGSEKLKDDFRHDFHQILAYCSFNNMETKQAMLIYPFSDFSVHKMNVSSRITHSSADIYLIGIPIERKKIESTEKEIINIIELNKNLRDNMPPAHKIELKKTE